MKRIAILTAGGDTPALNAMQPLSLAVPCVLAPKTIDNDLGLNYLDEPNEWILDEACDLAQPTFYRTPPRDELELEEIINYATPGYATAVFVVAGSIRRIRTTAESHRRIAIIEVMGRQSGYIALGSAYGQPDIILIPEVPLDRSHLELRVRELYRLQKHVVIVIGEGVVDADGTPLGEVSSSLDPAGNIRFSGAAEQLKQILVDSLGDTFFRARHMSADSAIFTRKVGHTQRGGRPVLFDRFYAAQLGGKALDLLLAGENNALATLQWSPERGFHVDSLPANKLADRWNTIRPRQVHHTLYDPLRFRPSRLGREYLGEIFSHAIGADDVEHIRTDLFNPGNLATRYQSVNIDMQKRIEYL